MADPALLLLLHDLYSTNFEDQHHSNALITCCYTDKFDTR